MKVGSTLVNVSLASIQSLSKDITLGSKVSSLFWNQNCILIWQYSISMRDKREKTKPRAEKMHEAPQTALDLQNSERS